MNAQLSYREVAVRGASPVGLVILLYQQIIEDLRRAVVACERNDIEARTREINHALLVLGHLEATLDTENGLAVAQNLTRFYRQLRAALVEAQALQSRDRIERQIALLMLVHAAWCEAERELALPAGTPAVAGASPGSDRSPADWKA